MNESSTSAPALEVCQLRHAFKKHVAVEDASFVVERGSIHGFVGPNGAGKTTTLKVICTLLKPQKGIVRIFGQDIKSSVRQVRQRIGFMPDHFSMYRQMTIFEYLDFFAAAYGLNLAARNTVIEDVLSITDMQGRKDDLIKGLSRGMQQRVSLARVLVNDPDLLLLDEPASGLDPRARIELMDILQALRDMGKTIFISSHILSELATLCDAVTIIDRGNIMFTGAISDLLKHPDQIVAYELQLDEPVDGLAQHLAALPGVDQAVCVEGKPVYHISLHPAESDTSALLRTAMEHNGQVVAFKRTTRQLNDAFMDLTTPGVRS